MLSPLAPAVLTCVKGVSLSPKKLEVEKPDYQLTSGGLIQMKAARGKAPEVHLQPQH